MPTRGPFLVRTSKGSFPAADAEQALALVRAAGEGLHEIIDQASGKRVGPEQLAPDIPLPGPRCGSTTELLEHVAEAGDLTLDAPPSRRSSGRLPQAHAGRTPARLQVRRRSGPTLALILAVSCVLLVAAVGALLLVPRQPRSPSGQEAPRTPVPAVEPARPTLPRSGPTERELRPAPPPLRVAVPPARPSPVQSGTSASTTPPQAAGTERSAAASSTVLTPPAIPATSAAVQADPWPPLDAEQRQRLRLALAALRQRRTAGLPQLPGNWASALHACAAAVEGLPEALAAQAPDLVRRKTTLPMGDPPLVLEEMDAERLVLGAENGRLELRVRDLAMDQLLALASRCDRTALARAGERRPAMVLALFSQVAPPAEPGTADALRLRAAAREPAAEPPEAAPPPAGGAAVAACRGASLDGRPLAPGAPVPSGAEIAVRGDGSLVLRWSDGLRAESVGAVRLRIGGEAALQLLAGSLRLVIPQRTGSAPLLTAEGGRIGSSGGTCTVLAAGPVLSVVVDQGSADLQPAGAAAVTLPAGSFAEAGTELSCAARPIPAPSVTGFLLLDGRGGGQPLENGTRLPKGHAILVQVLAQGDPAWITILDNGGQPPDSHGSTKKTLLRPERIPPFLVAGDENGIPNGWYPKPGAHCLIARPYTSGEKPGPCKAVVVEVR